MSRVEIIPAILPKDFAELVDKTSLIKGLVKTVQIDICDGQFVPNATWPYKKEDDNFKRILNQEEGLPGWQDLNFEIDLMANNPEELVEDWMAAGASRIVLHAEAEGDISSAIEKIVGKVEIGLALNMETEVEKILDSRFKIQEGAISSIQLMGIDNVGFQHQQFNENVIGKVRYARLKFPGMPISIDGGVSLENAEALLDAGADRLVVGSAIFDSDNFAEAIRKFKGFGRR